MKPLPAIFCMIFVALPAFAQNQPAVPNIAGPTVKTMPVPQAPVTAPQPPAAPGVAVPEQQSLTLQQQFGSQLNFPLDDAKMAAFVQATRRVKRINDKWDVQIAGAETDQRAIEYGNFAVEEITASFEKVPGLTLDEYKAMTKLTATNPEFNRTYLAYKDLVDQGKLKVPAESETTGAAVPTPTRPDVPAVEKPKVPSP